MASRIPLVSKLDLCVSENLARFMFKVRAVLCCAEALVWPMLGCQSAVVRRAVRCCVAHIMLRHTVLPTPVLTLSLLAPLQQLISGVDFLHKNHIAHRWV